MVKHSRRYQSVVNNVDTERLYGPLEAIDLVKESSNTKFDETVEVHLRTNADPRHADQMIRDVAVLPHGLGKPIRVLVFATGEAVDIARQAGADYVGDDDLIEQVEAGFTDFEVGLAIPQVMPKIGRLGRVLGRKGLMPNPRSGTLVQPQDLPRAIQEAKAGRVEFRTDRTAIIHSPIGKASFSTDLLAENLAVLTDSIIRSKPAAVKGSFLKSAFLASTMGPSVPMDLVALQALQPPE